jgi:ribosomal protein L13E
MTKQGANAMETIPQRNEKPTETDSEQVITSPLLPDLDIHPVPKEVLEQARAAIPTLRAHRDAIRAERGGRGFTEEELTGALHEARAAHERGE